MCVLPGSRMQQMPRLEIPRGAALLSGTRLIERMQKDSTLLLVAESALTGAHSQGYIRL
jgi:hypothetical protein